MFPKPLRGGTILTQYIGDFPEGDSSGEDSRAAMTFHPLATQAILGIEFYPINQLRISRLKRLFARWLTMRMSHNYRQAPKHGWFKGEGYHISLQTILEERGLLREKRLMDNVRSVRAALLEMKKQRILSEMHPFDEEIITAPSKRRPKIVNAIWDLFPSNEFVDEIISGNKEMKEYRNEGEGQLLPGFQVASGRGIR
jgi:hypothetical protein